MSSTHSSLQPFSRHPSPLSWPLPVRWVLQFQCLILSPYLNAHTMAWIDIAGPAPFSPSGLCPLSGQRPSTVLPLVPRQQLPGACQCGHPVRCHCCGPPPPSAHRRQCLLRSRRSSRCLLVRSLRNHHLLPAPDTGGKVYAGTFPHFWLHWTNRKVRFSSWQTDWE